MYNFNNKSDRVKALKSGIHGDIIEAVHLIKMGRYPNENVLRRFEGKWGEERL